MRQQIFRFLLTAATVAVAVSGASGLLDGVCFAASGGGSAYNFTNVSIGAEPDPVTGVPLPGHARVHYDVSWAGESFPGGHRCLWRLYDANGELVGEAERYLTSLEPVSSRLYTDVDVAGSPATVDITCDSVRLDDPDASVAIRNIRVAASMQPGKKVDVLFDYTWEGGSAGAQTCIVSARDEQGNVLMQRSSNFVPGEAAGRWLSSSFWLDGAHDLRQVRTADISCHPYVG